MANLRELRDKLATVKSTLKLTSAMKLVAGVKLRKAESQTISSRGYSDSLRRIVSSIRQDFLDYKPEILVGHKSVNTVLLVVFFSDKGLCGNFNYNLIKETKRAMSELHSDGKKVHILCLCQKAFDALKHFVDDRDKIDLISEDKKNDISFRKSKLVADYVIEKFNSYEVDKVCVIYTKYFSAMNKAVVFEKLMPVDSPEKSASDSVALMEPNEHDVLDKLLKENIAAQIYQAGLENFVSEQSSRMVAMDSAARNANELIGKLELRYNRLRQSMITLELVEVISGAEALNKG